MHRLTELVGPAKCQNEQAQHRFQAPAGIEVVGENLEEESAFKVRSETQRPIITTENVANCKLTLLCDVELAQLCGHWRRRGPVRDVENLLIRSVNMC